MPRFELPRPASVPAGRFGRALDREHDFDAYVYAAPSSLFRLNRLTKDPTPRMSTPSALTGSPAELRRRCLWFARRASVLATAITLVGDRLATVPNRRHRRAVYLYFPCVAGTQSHNSSAGSRGGLLKRRRNSARNSINGTYQAPKMSSDVKDRQSPNQTFARGRFGRQGGGPAGGGQAAPFGVISSPVSNYDDKAVSPRNRWLEDAYCNHMLGTVGELVALTKAPLLRHRSAGPQFDVRLRTSAS